MDDNVERPPTAQAPAGRDWSSVRTDRPVGKARAGRPDASSEDVEKLVIQVASAVSRRLSVVTEGMRETLADAIAELVADDRLLDLLGEAIEGNVGTILQMLRDHTPLRELTVPAAAVTHARRLAQQGVPVFAMVRAYRLGHAYLLEECFAELSDERANPALGLQAYNAINVRTLSYIDWVSQGVVTVYETERDQWVRHQDTVRTARIREILDGHGGRESVEIIHQTEAVLRYRLRQHHVAAVVWSEENTNPGSLGRLEVAITALAGALGDPAEALTVASDRSTTWAWLPRGSDDGDPDIDQLERALRAVECGDVRVAVGGTAVGLEGFRESHRQAVQAQQVFTAGDHTTRQVVGYREPGLAAAALLTGHLEQTRTLVYAALGPLAGDDSNSERLRETLLGFLESGCNYSTAATRFNLHKNTVRYRVERALELRGRPLGDDRIDVELALIACRWLPGPCLGDAPAAPGTPHASGPRQDPIRER